MTAGAGRALAGVAVTVAVVLVLIFTLRGGGGPAAAGTATQPSAPGAVTRSAAAGLAPGADAVRSSRSAPGPSSGRTAPVAGRTAAATGTAHADPLGTAAAGYTATREGTVLAAVYDVRTGQTWHLGLGHPQAEASVVKLNILEALLARDGGTLPPGDQSLARAMIEDSDNDAATSLWDEAGGAAGLAGYNAQAGLTATVPSSCVTCAGFPWPGWGLTTTLPQDQLILLRQLVTPGAHPPLSQAARAYALSLLENVTPDQRWGVSGGVPAGVSVALKNGWLPLNDAATDWQVNSVGWVSGDARDYLVAVLTTGNPSEQYGIDTVSGLSALIWSAMR